MLTLTSLTAGYGPVTALEDVSLTAREGEITAVLGANGAGKTTLLRTVSGLHRARSGTIDFDGTRLESVAAEKMPRLGLAHVPEGRGVITELTVEENLRLGGLGRGGRVSASDLERVHDLFPILGDRSAALASTLSGGERQMLVIGRALMARPTMLLLDEPSLGLAPLVVQQLLEAIRAINAGGTTILLAEQNAQAALGIASRGYVLENGRVVLEGARDALLGNEGVKRAYLGM
jgi:branched-chain amino acid transport system ATP-binding protein